MLPIVTVPIAYEGSVRPVGQSGWIRRPQTDCCPRQPQTWLMLMSAPLDPAAIMSASELGVLSRKPRAVAPEPSITDEATRLIASSTASGSVRTPSSPL